MVYPSATRFQICESFMRHGFWGLWAFLWYGTCKINRNGEWHIPWEEVMLAVFDICRKESEKNARLVMCDRVALAVNVPVSKRYDYSLPLFKRGRSPWKCRFASKLTFCYTCLELKYFTWNGCAFLFSIFPLSYSCGGCYLTHFL